MFNISCVLAILLPCLLVAANGEIEKRQVGMLARSGELPNRGGKRSVGALARNGELPGKRDMWGSTEQQRLRLLSQWLKDMNAAIQLEQAVEHEVAKRNMEAMARAGYLVKPATDAPETRTGLLDSDEFLGKDDIDEINEIDDSLEFADSKRGGIAALVKHGYMGKRDDEDDEIAELEQLLSPADKRHLAAVKSFISRFAKRNLGAFRNFGQKRNLGAARNFALLSKRYEISDNDIDDEKRNLGSARRFTGKRNLGAARNFQFINDDIDADKRNLGSARRFTGKRNLGAARNFKFTETKRNLGAARQFFSDSKKKNVGSARSFMYGKRNLASLARDGGFPKHFGREDDYPWDDDYQFDFDDFHDDEKRNIASFVRSLPAGKRYLGSLRTGKRSAAFDDDGLASVQSDTPYEDIHDFLGKDQDDSATIAKRETKDGEAGQGKSEEGGASRGKRSAEYAFSPNELPLDLQEYNDYEEAIYPNGFNKRFLGAPRTSARDVDGWTVDKRHIGALARMGLLPSFRSSRYSRSGRAVSNRIVPFREDPPIRSCFASKDSAPWTKTPAATAQLAIRRSAGPAALRIVTYAPFGTRSRHPMAFHKSFYQ